MPPDHQSRGTRSGSPRRRKGRPERIRVSLIDRAPNAVPISLPARRWWPVGLVFAVMCAIFGGIAVGQIASIQGHQIDTVFDLAFVLFQGFWVLGWSVAVLVLFLLTVLFLFYGESARIAGDRLVHVPRLGPLKILVEYDLAKIRNLRVVSAGADGGRIRFDYGDGDNGLGNEMPRAEAEARVRIIQAAMEALGVRPDRPAPVGAGAPAPSGADAEPRPREPREPPDRVEPPSSASAVALLGANLVPLAGVLLLGWDLGEVMTLFWAENAVIGFYTLLKLAVVARWGVLFLGPFFLGHYGGFMAGHFLFIYYLFVRGIEASGPEAGPLAALTDLFVPLWPALVALVVSHGISFYSNFLGRKEYVGRKAQEQMAEPYKRIIVLHVTIIFGGWFIMLLRSPVPALVLLIALKTAVDLRAHRREHGKNIEQGTSETQP
jgi:hypothetical protein